MYGLSNEAYKVTINIARSRLQVMLMPAVMENSMLLDMRFIPTDLASRPGQALNFLASAFLDAAGLGGSRKMRRADLRGLRQALVA